MWLTTQTFTEQPFCSAQMRQTQNCERSRMSKGSWEPSARLIRQLPRKRFRPQQRYIKAALCHQARSATIIPACSRGSNIMLTDLNWASRSRFLRPHVKAFSLHDEPLANFGGRAGEFREKLAQTLTLVKPSSHRHHPLVKSSAPSNGRKLFHECRPFSCDISSYSRRGTQYYAALRSDIGALILSTTANRMISGLS